MMKLSTKKQKKMSKISSFSLEMTIRRRYFMRTDREQKTYMIFFQSHF